MTTPPDDPYPAVRRLLDELPPPEVRPVDVPAVYAAAAAVQARQARRWKYAAAAAAALAAGVGLFAVLPGLEVRAGNGELAVRWGPPPAAAGSEADPTAARLAAAEAAARAAAAKADRLEERLKEIDRLTYAQRELKDLLLVVAADANKLDQTQQAAAEHQRKLAVWVAAQLRDVDGKLAEVRKDSSAMYTLIADSRNHREGENR
jgi:hypothetical protein